MRRNNKQHRPCGMNTSKTLIDDGKKGEAVVQDDERDLQHVLTHINMQSLPQA